VHDRKVLKTGFISPSKKPKLEMTPGSDDSFVVQATRGGEQAREQG